MSSETIYHPHSRLTFTKVAQKQLQTLEFFDRIPYVYWLCWLNEVGEIRFQYVGARYAKGCHPNELFTFYNSSSRTVELVIEQYGEPSIIEVRRIFQNVESTLEWETTILRRFDVRRNHHWLNSHHNEHVQSPEKRKEFWYRTLGVSSPSCLPSVRQKTEQTCLKKYGVENPLQNEIVYSKLQNTCKLKYGVSNVFCSEEIKIKSKETKLERYGDENYNNRKKMKETKRQNHGDENYNNREQCVRTLMTEFGVENVSQLEEVKEKKRKVYEKHYGVSHFMKDPETANRIIETNKRNHGGVLNIHTEENKAKAQEGCKKFQEFARNNPFTCPHCNKQIIGRTNYNRWHGDNCKFKPQTQALRSVC